VEIHKDVEAASLDAHGELADVGHPRLAPADVMIAACAHVAGMDVLHYDSDYGLRVKHTGLRGFGASGSRGPACSDWDSGSQSVQSAR
jgi:predicted nucleic acid-binding protein